MFWDCVEYRGLVDGLSRLCSYVREVRTSLLIPIKRMGILQFRVTDADGSNVVPVSVFILLQMLSNSLQPVLLAKVVMVFELIECVGVGKCFLFF